MLKFVNENAVYNFEREGIQFVGIGREGHVVCHVTKQAVLACTDGEDASAIDLLEIFELNRQFFEDIANLEYAAGTRDIIYIDRFHVEQPAFIHHLAQARRTEHLRVHAA